MKIIITAETKLDQVVAALIAEAEKATADPWKVYDDGDEKIICINPQQLKAIRHLALREGKAIKTTSAVMRSASELHYKVCKTSSLTYIINPARLVIAFYKV